jgi:hypothetical protein
MCSGKTTVSDIILKNDGVFRGSSDRIKWLISNYSGENPNHRLIAKNITLSAIEGAVKAGLSIVIDGGFGDHRDKYKEIAVNFDLKYLSVNIEAPYEILKQRFLERVESSKQSGGKKISVDTIEGFNNRYEWYESYNRDLEAITFDSSIKTAEEIVLEIEHLISLKNNGGTE